MCICAFNLRTSSPVLRTFLPFAEASVSAPATGKPFSCYWASGQRLTASLVASGPLTVTSFACCRRRTSPGPARAGASPAPRPPAPHHPLNHPPTGTRLDDRRPSVRHSQTVSAPSQHGVLSRDTRANSTPPQPTPPPLSHPSAVAQPQRPARSPPWPLPPPAAAGTVTAP